MLLVRYRLGGRPSLCGLTLAAPPEGEGILAILHELPENPGVSISVAIDRVIAAARTQHPALLAAAPFHRIRWIERYYGIEDGIPEMLAETVADISPGPDGWQVRPKDCLPVGSQLLRHIRRELARLGDDAETAGCFNIH